MKPLNGEKIHPLSDYAHGVLRMLALSPAPVCEVNPGVINRLLREDLARCGPHPSPFKVHKGKPIEHLHITDAGRAVVRRSGSERE